ncbi:helix-turn-helix domain-containing protein [Actinoallomurus iriomotensis]|uniref:Uncharacterized protein n=1 Tax=Actinoallomurus iriomotensis TaxID=478107 RepID=A0A9W6RU39_9ACTN|nr:helix-turn-helix transcriptional regulator [Actinoallomurus iriomotensis]GLY81886.1 hypothetical protein Airi01_101530 [Actinoallomurus iriomotensis]
MTQKTTEPCSPMQGRRIELGLTLRDLAAACSRAGGPISDSQLSKVERGLYTPRPAARRAIKTVLGLDPVTGADKAAREGGKS